MFGLPAPYFITKSRRLLIQVNPLDIRCPISREEAITPTPATVHLYVIISSGKEGFAPMLWRQVAPCVPSLADVQHILANLHLYPIFDDRNVSIDQEHAEKLYPDLQEVACLDNGAVALEEGEVPSTFSARNLKWICRSSPCTRLLRTDFISTDGKRLQPHCQ